MPEAADDPPYERKASMSKERLSTVLFIVGVAAVALFIIFGDDISEWMIHALKASADSQLGQLLR